MNTTCSGPCEDRRAIRADDAILDDRVDARTGLHAVHMRRQHDRRQGFKPICSREVRDEIATVAADCLTGLVLAHRAAELLQALRQQVTNLPLVMCRTRNGNELQKLRERHLDWVDLGEASTDDSGTGNRRHRAAHRTSDLRERAEIHDGEAELLRKRRDCSVEGKGRRIAGA